jgi:AbrB family looped-hinge helix DNA binding protein
MYTSAISSQGQITLPKPLREAINLPPNSSIVIDYDVPTRSITIRPAESIDDTTKRISSYLKPSHKPIINIRAWLNENKEIRK